MRKGPLTWLSEAGLKLVLGPDSLPPASSYRPTPVFLPNGPASFSVPPSSKANLIGPVSFAMPPAWWADLLHASWHC
ncbi:hypothetical protein EYF80_003434 [Liparis tanakae]|uniref:Uncharacterized protein n=1 Tax=Liparis tanakae TaxID=230148 RepID=A0A4Z2J850_9TELE|nr:hypothetical protein EYF80_003434 [Liparis tanakae]